MTIRAFAIDWSGAVKNAGQKIWLAEAVEGQLLRLEGDRDREAVTDHLIERKNNDPMLVVGLDFAFSFPEAFCRERGLHAITDVWNLVEKEGESWLKACSSPFWGRAGTKGPKDRSGFRATELEVARQVKGAQPKSIFQICGAGAVGTGSIRGIPFLNKLKKAGFSIWPFYPLQPPCIIEIYPRALTKSVNKSSRDARMKYLSEGYSSISAVLLERAASNEDAFDAAVSALVMARRIDEILALPPASDDQTRLEGQIWY